MGGSSSEEAAELVATIRGDHVVMKAWYNGPSEEAVNLQTKYGPYPGLWKEVLNWPGWKEARKSYLKFTQMEEGTKDDAVVKNDDVPRTTTTNTTNDETNNGDTNAAGRKRRSRWGTAEEGGNNNDSNSNYNDSSSSNNDAASKRRSRWGRDEAGANPGTTTTTAAAAAAAATALPGGFGMIPPPPPPPAMGVQPSLPGLAGLVPGMPANLTPQQQQEMVQWQSRLREINELIDNLELEAARVDALPRDHRERSPSPPPVYGADGVRKNTRAVRWRQRYTAERQDILEKLMNLNPATRQSGLFKRKRTRKVRIPIEKHPQYNFIGLIIGPRGKTQKELESKTGCKIAIRGRGSVKEGARGRRDGKVMDSDDEPLHVVITGDDQRSVDAATDMIEQMLVVIDDEKNVHKQQQLRELALLNGTLKEDEYCQICGEKGHRSFECPKRFSVSNNKKTIQIKCGICGDTSHPTRDCTQKQSTTTEGPPATSKEMDSDYMSFMAELDGKKVDKAPISSPPGAPPAGDGGAPTSLPKPPLSSSTNPGGDLQPPPQVNLPPPPTGVVGLPPHNLLHPPPMSGLPPPPPPPPPPPLQGGGVMGHPPPIGTGGLIPPSLPIPPVANSLMGGNVNPNGDYYGTSNHYQNHLPQQYNNNNNNYSNHRGGGPPARGGGRGGGYNNNYGNHSGGGGGYPNQQQPTQYGNNPQQQDYPPQQDHLQQQAQQQQEQVGDETQAWDYTAYYGQGDGGGAGGFNWWEN